MSMTCGEFENGICIVCEKTMANHPIFETDDGFKIPFIEYGRCPKQHIHIGCPAVIFHEEGNTEEIKKLIAMPATKEIDIVLKIPIFLLSAWEELYKKTNPMLSQDAAMLLFALKVQLNEVLQKR